MSRVFLFSDIIQKSSGDKAKVSKLNISCIVCHNDKAILHKLQEGQPEKGVLYITDEVASHPDKVFKTVKKSSVMDHSVYCGQCHGLGPNFDAENPFQCATLYGNYIHAYIPHGGTQSCQDCHMKEVDGIYKFTSSPNYHAAN